MSAEAIADRRHAMATLLAEVAPSARYDVQWSDSWQRAGVAWDSQPDHAQILKASFLALLRQGGPDVDVRCSAHTSLLSQCDRIPVSWALLGHTCGRAS